MLVDFVKKYSDLVVYVLLYCSYISLNKYVLSVLNFLYPTIFQGWQMLVGGIFLRVLRSSTATFKSSSVDLDKEGFISLSPSFLFFAGGCVACSKALAGLSVPIFLSLQSSQGALIYLLRTPSSKGSLGLIGTLASIGVILSATFAVLFDIDGKFSDSPYFWMLVYLACQIAQILHAQFADQRYSDADRIYYSYVCSLIILAPASLYLDEAFQVLKFPNASRYDFGLGCLFSGIFGLFLNITLLKVRYETSFYWFEAGSRLILSVISQYTFKDSNSVIVNVLIFTTIFLSIFIPVYQYPDKEIESTKNISQVEVNLLTDVDL